MTASETTPISARSDLLVPVRYYLRLSDTLAGIPVDIPEQLTSAGSSRQAVLETDGRVPFGVVDTFINRLFEATQRTDLGFALGPHLSVSSHSVVGFGMLTCANLGEALQFTARYFRLIMPSFRLSCTLDQNQTVLHFTPLVAMSRLCLSFHLEAIALAAYHDVRALSGGRAPAELISFSIPEPDHDTLYRKLNCKKILFSNERTPGVWVVFSGNASQIALAHADPNALKVAEERCRAQVGLVTREGELSDWVAMMMREVDDRLPKLEELASVLHISPRTLNRRLKSEGTTFREIYSQVQHGLAKERLLLGTQSVSSIAYSLGYRDASNFTHAFKRREGLSPSAFLNQYSRK